MNVSELIETLKEFPADTPVLLRAWNGWEYNLMGDVEVTACEAFRMDPAEFREAPEDAWRDVDEYFGLEAGQDPEDDDEWKTWDDVVESCGVRNVVVLSSEAVDDNADRCDPFL